MRLAQLNRLVQRAKLPWKHLASTPQLLVNRRRALLRLRTSSQINIAAEEHYNRTSQGEKGVYGPNETLAYVSRRLLPAHSVLRRVLGEAKFLKPESRPIKRMLDFGAGPGTAIWAAGAVWPESLDSAYAVDKHRSMLDALEFLWNPTDSDEEVAQGKYRKMPTKVDDEEEEANEEIDKGKYEEGEDNDDEEEDDNDDDLDDSEREVGWLRELDEAASDWKPPANFRLHTSRDELVRLLENVQRNPTESRYDLVTAAWVLGDIADQDSRATMAPSTRYIRSNKNIPKKKGEEMKIISGFDATVIGLWECVAPGGFLVLTDYGDLKGSKRIMDARALILEKYGFKADNRQLRKYRKSARKSSKSFAEMVAPCTHQYTCPFANSKAFDIVQPSTSAFAKYKNIQKNGKSKKQELGDSEKEDKMEKGGRGGATGGWCRFVQRVVTPERKKAQGFPTADERFSYLVIYKTDPNDVKIESELFSKTELTSSEAYGEEDVDEDFEQFEQEMFKGRVIRTPLKRKGHTVIDVCRPNTIDGNRFDKELEIEDFDTDELFTSPGSKKESRLNTSSGGGAGASIERVVISKSKYPSLYSAARKASWGGQWVSHEAKYAGVSKPDSGLLLEDVTRYYQELGYSPEEALNAALGKIELDAEEEAEEELVKEKQQQEMADELEMMSEDDEEESKETNPAALKRRLKKKQAKRGEEEEEALTSQVDDFLARISNLVEETPPSGKNTPPTKSSAHDELNMIESDFEDTVQREEVKGRSGRRGRTGRRGTRNPR